MFTAHVFEKRMTLEEFYAGKADMIIPYCDIECLYQALLISEKSKIVVENSELFRGSENSRSQKDFRIDGATIVMTLLNKFNSDKVKSLDNLGETIGNVKTGLKLEATGALSLLILQHQLAEEFNLNSLARRNCRVSAETALKSLYLRVFKPLILSVRDRQKKNPTLPKNIDFRKRTRTAAEVSQPPSYPTSAAGQYGIISKFGAFDSYTSFSAHVICAEVIRGADAKQASFLCFENPKPYSNLTMKKEIDGSGLTRLVHLLDRCQLASTAVLRKVEGVRFIGDDRPPYLVLEWPVNSITLEEVVLKHGGLLCHEKPLIDAFRLMACQMISAVSSIHACGIICRGISPSTLIIGESGTKVILLPISIDPENVQDDDSSDIKCYRDDLLRNDQYLSAAALPPVKECIGNDIDSLMTPSTSWDSWSVGLCLFTMAFGLPATDVLLQIIERNSTQNQKQEQAVSFGCKEFCDVDSAHSLLIGDTISYLMNTRRDFDSVKTNKTISTFLASSSRYLYIVISRMLKRKTQILMEHGPKNEVPSVLLFEFRHTFAEESLSIGLSELSSCSLWERFIQGIFCRCHQGIRGAQRVRDEIASITSTPNIDAIKVRDIFCDQYGIHMTVQEVELVMRSLTPSLGRDYLFRDRLVPALQVLGRLVDDIYSYGSLQQIIYAITSCLSEHAEFRPSMQQLLDLEVFSDLDDASFAKATKDFSLKIQKYDSPAGMVQDVMLSRIRVALTRLAGEDVIAGDLSVSSELLSSDVDKVSFVLSSIEELSTLWCNQVAGREHPPGPTLTIPGLSAAWVCEHSSGLLQAVAKLSVLPSIAAYALRFFALNTTTMVSKDSMDRTKAGGRDPSLDLSIGSRLMMRVVKSLQHMVECLEHLSKFMQRRGTDIIDMGSVNDTIDREYNDDVLSFVIQRDALEGLFLSVLSTTAMLYIGSESPLFEVGPAPTDFSSSFPSLLVENGSAEEVLLNEILYNICTDNRWSVQVCKLVEPLLLCLVSEDGTGAASRVKCSRDSIAYIDKTSSRASVHITISDRLYTENIDEPPLPIYYPPYVIPHRGSVYFSGCVRLFRSYCTLVLSPKLTESRNRHLFATMSLNLLPQSTVSSRNSNEAEVIEDDVITPSSSMFQTVQMLLDTRLSSKLQACVPSGTYGTDTSGSLESIILKCCFKAMDFCRTLQCSFRLSEPFRSLSLEFSSPPWVHTAACVLRSTKSTPEVCSAALNFLRVMSKQQSWMRHWGTFEIFPILLSTARKSSGVIKKVALECFYSAVNLCPDFAVAMIEMRLISPTMVSTIDSDDSEDTHPLNLKSNLTMDSLLREANDLSFGSTLREQEIFADRLDAWTVSNVVDIFIVAGGTVNGLRRASLFDLSRHGSSSECMHILEACKAWKLPALQIIQKISGWLPTLCLAVEIKGGTNVISSKIVQPLRCGKHQG